MQVFNCPGCDDVYTGVEVDYRHSDVNATNFLSVLSGDSEAMRGIGTGRVIASGAHDRVFVYYTDHGAAGAHLPPSSVHFRLILVQCLPCSEDEEGLADQCSILWPGCQRHIGGGGSGRMGPFRCHSLRRWGPPIPSD